MSSLTLSSSRGISRLLKAVACSKRGALTVCQCVSRTHHQCPAMNFVPIHFGESAALHLRYPVSWASQLRVYSSPAPSVQQKTEIIKKIVRSLLEEEPTGPAKMPMGDLSFDEKSKASSLIPHYLVSIASDPHHQHKSILELFRLYALTMRPLAHDKIEYPEEFKCVIPATERAFQLMSISELHAMSQYLSCLECQKLALVQSLIRALCQECAARVYREQPTFMEALSLYNLALSTRALKRDYYDIFNEYFFHNIDNASLKEKVKLMYFYSLNPMQSYTSLFEEIIKSMVPHVASMPFKLQGVVASSVLKSGMKLHRDLPLLPELVPNLVNCLLSNNQLDDLESFCIVSEIDLMRLSYYNNEDVTAALESFLISCNEEKCLTVQNMKCFLAFLASRSYNQIVFEKLEAYLVEILRDETRDSLLLADLARILWAMSATSHNCSNAFIEEVKRELHSQVAVGLINANLLKFVDALISLAMMGHVDLNLCRHAFGRRKGRSVSYGGHLEVKLYSRIASLQECLRIERPEVILPAPDNRSVSSAASEPTSQLKERPALGKLHAVLNTALAWSPDVALSFGCPLMTVKLSGICLVLKHEDSGAQITGSGAQISGSGAQITGSGVQISGSGVQISGSGPQISVSGAQITGSGAQISGSGAQISGSGAQITGSGAQISGSGAQISGSGAQISGSGAQISGSGAQITGSGAQISGSGAQISGSGAQISASGTQNSDSSATTHVTSAGSGDEVHSESRAYPGTARLRECLDQLQRPVSLEVQDATTTIPEGSSSRRHTGQLNYKMRLMEKIGWKCVLVSQKDIEESDDVMSLVVDKLQESCIKL